MSQRTVTKDSRHRSRNFEIVPDQRLASSHQRVNLVFKNSRLPWVSFGQSSNSTLYRQMSGEGNDDLRPFEEFAHSRFRTRLQSLAKKAGCNKVFQCRLLMDSAGCRPTEETYGANGVCEVNDVGALNLFPRRIPSRS